MTELLTPYRVAKIINEMLSHRGIKEIPTQMIYNYVRKGYIVSVLPNRISFEEAERFANEYIAKKELKVNK
jgi:hypothetical protein